MKKSFLILAGFVLQIMLVGCNANNTTEIPALTNTPLPTLTSTITPTETPEPTRTPVPTPSPIYVTLGSPFAATCGDGTPIIWAMNSYNGPDTGQKAVPGGAGHSDILAPSGCSPLEFEGEIIMPVSGAVVLYRQGEQGSDYDIVLPPNTYLDGTKEALIFAGVTNPDLTKIKSFIVRMGHVNLSVGTFMKGDSIGDMVYDNTVPKNPLKVAYEIRITYKDILYKLSPNLFSTDHEWICPPINNGCTPIPQFYGTR